MEATFKNNPERLLAINNTLFHFRSLLESAGLLSEDEAAAYRNVQIALFELSREEMKKAIAAAKEVQA